MRILVVNCHWGNRGDEAAIRAMLNEIQFRYPEAEIFVQSALGSFGSFPENEHVKVIPTFPGKRIRNLPIDYISVITNGRINLSSDAKLFFDILKTSDIVVHAPGGPSIGDIYYRQERIKLWRLDLIRKSGVPYFFYAPSMGPFKKKTRNRIRKLVIEQAKMIVLREELSAQMVKEFVPNSSPIVTLDSAFQYTIDQHHEQSIYERDVDLVNFIGTGENVIGVTITDLQWNAAYNKDNTFALKIRDVFSKFIKYLSNHGYRVLFIPQLFGGDGDEKYMTSFAGENCFVVSSKNDCFYQQFIISKLKAVVGMRYHSNIFSAKMGTPFISVSYEQKMLGFMGKAGLRDYCIKMNDLSFDKLVEKFNLLVDNYDEYKAYLLTKQSDFKNQSYKTTELLCDCIESLS